MRIGKLLHFCDTWFWQIWLEHENSSSPIYHQCIVQPPIKFIISSFESCALFLFACCFVIICKIEYRPWFTYIELSQKVQGVQYQISFKEIGITTKLHISNDISYRFGRNVLDICIPWKRSNCCSCWRRSQSCISISLGDYISNTAQCCILYLVLHIAVFRYTSDHITITSL